MPEIGFAVRSAVLAHDRIQFLHESTDPLAGGVLVFAPLACRLKPRAFDVTQPPMNIVSLLYLELRHELV